MDEKPHVIGRVAALLRAVASHEPAGASTTDLARSTELARPTAHRLLSSLAAEGLLDRHPNTGRWSLGPELFLLGTLAADRYDITELAHDIVRDLARETGESAFLSARRGDESVCLAEEEGSFPLRSHVLHVGLRLPLGVASAGLAILSHLSEREIDEYLARVDLTSAWGAEHSSSSIRERIEETRSAGYAVNPGLLVPGSWGMGAAVFDHRGTPAWALSLTGVESRFPAERLPGLGKLLLQQAHRLSRRLRDRNR